PPRRSVPTVSHVDGVRSEAIEELIEGTEVVGHNVLRYTGRLEHSVRQRLHLLWRNTCPIYRGSSPAALGPPSIEHCARRIVLLNCQHYGRCCSGPIAYYVCSSPCVEHGVVLLKSRSSSSPIWN